MQERYIVATGWLVWFGNPVRPSPSAFGEASVEIVGKRNLGSVDICCWLVWNMILLFLSHEFWEFHDPNSRSPSFFRGVETTKQVGICWYLLISSIFGLKSLIHWHDWPRKIATWDSSVILRILGWYTDILGEPLLDIGKRVFLLNDKWSID